MNENNYQQKFLLDRNAKYSISEKALLKWSNDRLTMNVLSDGTIFAKFRYNGTTCSNLGHELIFDYHIELSSSEESYRIKSLKCIPVNNGYTFMCEYSVFDNGVMNEIEFEKPLIGKPLNEILAWKRNYNPEGCYCKKESRDYKWGIVFEVLHYKLVQNEINIKSEVSSQVS